jgi:hypothetical protein
MFSRLPRFGRGRIAEQLTADRMNAIVDAINALKPAPQNKGLLVKQTKNGVSFSINQKTRVKPHPFQIIVESATEFRVNAGNLHLPGLAFFGSVGGSAVVLFVSTDLASTDITTVDDYDPDGDIYIYLTVEYVLEGDYLAADTTQGNDIVASGVEKGHTVGESGGTAYFPIGRLTIIDGEIVGPPAQYIRSDYTEAISGIYIPPSP